LSYHIKRKAKIQKETSNRNHNLRGLLKALKRQEGRGEGTENSLNTRGARGRLFEAIAQTGNAVEGPKSPLKKDPERKKKLFSKPAGAEGRGTSTRCDAAI